MKTEKITDWISVEKELPKVEMEYLVTLETKFLSETCTHICTYIDLAYFSKDLYAVDNCGFQDKQGIAGFYKHTWNGGVHEVKPKAWQPLPEKFKERIK